MKQAVDFTLKNQDGEEVKLSSFKGKNIVLYFYPKDNTSGCTKEAQEFSQYKDEFEKENCVILGVSKDSVKSHKNFVEKKELSIALLSDENLDVIKSYGAWGKKKMYGKEYEGVIRSTFLIDKNFNIIKEWRKVRVKGHVKDVLASVKKLNEKN